MVDHQPGVTEDVPGNVKQRRHRVLTYARLLVLQSEQVYRVNEHKTVLHPIQDHFHRNLPGIRLREDEGQHRTVHVIHLNPEYCCGELTGLCCQEVDLGVVE